MSSMMINLIKGLLPEIGINPDAPIEKQSVPTHNVERVFAEWFMEKKANSKHAGRMVLMFDVQPNGVMIMVPVIMNEPTNWKIPSTETIALLDAALRSQTVNEKDEFRADRLREAYQHVREMYAKAANGDMIDTFLVDEGINVTSWGQRIPVFAIMLPLIELLTSISDNAGKTAEELAEEEAKMEAGITHVVSLLREAARLPECRLAPKQKPVAIAQQNPVAIAQQKAVEIPVETGAQTTTPTTADAPVVDSAPQNNVDALGENINN